MPHGREIFRGDATELGRLHESRWQWLEEAVGPAVAL
ncbi:AraC family transcriptional regulator, partial [Mesorhizobium sp. M00.F.Ca.ET.038.03.1.1]